MHIYLSIYYYNIPYFLFVITLDYSMRQAIDGREAEFRFERIQRQGHTCRVIRP